MAQMSKPTPLQSFVGGAGLAIPIQFRLVLNGSILGISGLLHGAVRGGSDALVSIIGFLMSGALIGVVEGAGPETISVGLPRIAFAGLLVGIGSKLASGCTSGHMLCGLSRFSPRSLVATATFFVTAAVTAHFAYGNAMLPVRSADWTIGTHGSTFLALQAVPFAVSTLLYFLGSATLPSTAGVPKQTEPRPLLRLLASLITSFEFALALRLSNLSDPHRVISFLLLPFDRGFDPSLAYLAIGALPFATILYQFGRGKEQPRLGGQWVVPKGGVIDSKLVLGAAIFGVGWGLAGICPGPGLINLGRALVNGSGIRQTAAWLGTVVLGGLLV